MPKKTVLVAVLAITLFACSSAHDDAESFAPPAGCKLTYCDHEHDECKALYKSDGSQCSECWSYCTPSNAVSCSQTCSSICRSGSGASTDPCGDYRDTCRKTEDNRVCIDGVATADLPDSIPGDSKWHQPWEREAMCTDAEIQTTLDAFTKGTWSFEKSVTNYGTCARCIAVNYDVSDPWAALVVRGNAVWVNRGGCIAHIEGDVSETSHGAAISNYDECLAATCAAANDIEACRAIVDRTECKRYVSAAKAAEAAIGADRTFEATCGRADEAFVPGAKKVITFFCGGKTAPKR